MTAEELETSKEELQSINEELQTVNSELKLKLEALSRAHSDLQNLMAATDYGTLILDTGLRIKRFTEPVTRLFRVTPTDEGRPITDFAHQLEYDDLSRDAQGVLSNLLPLQREVRSRDGHWYDLRLRPYRTMDNRIDGVVITFVDVTDRRNAEAALRDRERQLHQLKRLLELSRNPIFVWNLDGGIVDWNRGCEELYGYNREEALGRPKEELLGTTVPGSSFQDLKDKLVATGSWSGELLHRTKDGRWLTVEARLDLEYLDGNRLVLESTRDVMERKQLQRRQELLVGELAHRVKNSLAVVQSIAQQTLRSSPSPQDFVKRFEGRLAALSAAHGLLLRSHWRGAELAKLARLQLKPYAGEDRLHIEGPPVTLPADLATPFGLVLHELATNAAKYGSLSRRGGGVDLRWTVHEGNGSQRLSVTWQETGGEPPSEEITSGFGSRLIENGIANAEVRREFGPTGLVCTIDVVLPVGQVHGAGDPGS